MFPALSSSPEARHAVASRELLNHAGQLVFRALLLAVAIWFYSAGAEKLDFTGLPRSDTGAGFLYLVFLALAVGMMLRIFPNRRIPMGARKHFSAGPPPENSQKVSRSMLKQLHKGAFVSALAWICLNAAVFAALHVFNMLNPGAAVVLMLAYAVCDIICILIFCPFQAFFMGNRCCSVCRIYNWDYLMICTPMIPFLHPYSAGLLLLSAAVVIRWETAVLSKPYLFIEETNENLGCTLCEDRLCRLNIMMKKGMKNDEH